MFIQLKKKSMACLLSLYIPTILAQPLNDFGDGVVLRQKWQALARGEPVKIRVVQIGDSHTAGGFFTDTLRQDWQQRWGNGGIGWVFPNQIKGQRTSIVRYQGAWSVLTSRKEKAEFPFGGVLARSYGGSVLMITPTVATLGEQNIRLIFKPVFAMGSLIVVGGNAQNTMVSNQRENKWQAIDFTAVLPLNIQAQESDLWEIGPINIENNQGGVVVSALGINGAQLSQWQNWRTQWAEDLAQTHADLIILSYGTNEAFNQAIRLDEVEQIWSKTIQRIRATLPQAAILIVGAPESLTSKNGGCGIRAPHLDGVQAMQQRLAQQHRTLYWSWQQAMGGACSMNIWLKQKLAATDGVHFSALGYKQAATVLSEAVNQWVEQALP